MEFCQPIGKLINKRVKLNEQKESEDKGGGERERGRGREIRVHLKEL